MMMMITIDRGRRSSFKVADIPVIEERRGSVIEPRDISLSLSLSFREKRALEQIRLIRSNYYYR